MEYDQITIQGETFRVPVRYAEGHTLNANEAAALNQTYHENLRNNFAKKVVEGKEANLDKSVLQQQLDDYANDYQFGVRTGGGGGFRGDPVMTRAMDIARGVIRKAVKDNNLSEDEWPAVRISQAAKALLDQQGEDGTIIKIARQQIDAEKAAQSAALGDLGDMLQPQAAQ